MEGNKTEEKIEYGTLHDMLMKLKMADPETREGVRKELIKQYIEIKQYRVAVIESYIQDNPELMRKLSKRRRTEITSEDIELINKQIKTELEGIGIFLRENDQSINVDVLELKKIYNRLIEKQKSTITEEQDEYDPKAIIAGEQAKYNKIIQVTRAFKRKWQPVKVEMPSGAIQDVIPNPPKLLANSEGEVIRGATLQGFANTLKIKLFGPKKGEGSKPISINDLYEINNDYKFIVKSRDLLLDYIRQLCSSIDERDFQTGLYILKTLQDKREELDEDNKDIFDMIVKDLNLSVHRIPDNITEVSNSLGIPQVLIDEAYNKILEDIEAIKMRTLRLKKEEKSATEEKSEVEKFYEQLESSWIYEFLNPMVRDVFPDDKTVEDYKSHALMESIFQDTAVTNFEEFMKEAKEKLIEQLNILLGCEHKILSTIIRKLDVNQKKEYIIREINAKTQEYIEETKASYEELKNYTEEEQGNSQEPSKDVSKTTTLKEAIELCQKKKEEAETVKRKVDKAKQEKEAKEKEAKEEKANGQNTTENGLSDKDKKEKTKLIVEQVIKTLKDNKNKLLTEGVITQETAKKIEALPQKIDIDKLDQIVSETKEVVEEVFEQTKQKMQEFRKVITGSNNNSAEIIESINKVLEAYNISTSLTEQFNISLRMDYINDAIKVIDEYINNNTVLFEGKSYYLKKQEDCIRLGTLLLEKCKEKFDDQETAKEISTEITKLEKGKLDKAETEKLIDRINSIIQAKSMISPKPPEKLEEKE